MNTSEQETIGLCIALEAVGDIANHALLDILDVDGIPGEAEVRYKTDAHQQLFLVRLLDFSKETSAKSLTGVSGSCLDVLLAACETRSFDVGGSVDALAASATALRDWLDARSSLKLWLPTLEIEAKLTVPRHELLFILGNHVKHNLARLTGVCTRVATLFNEHGYEVSPEQVPLALDDIREHLEANYFVYYGTWLAELVNNVRWGLQDYLLPVFRQSFAMVPGDAIRYEYHFPASVSDAVARQWFWRLMNHVRAKPYIKRFVGANYLKRASSLE